MEQYHNHNDNSTEENPALVIDNGSGMVKAGFSGEEAPCVVFPSIIGKPKYSRSMKHLDKGKDIYVGSDAYAKRGVLKLSYPIEHGIVSNWDDMTRIWEHTFEQLRVDQEDRNVLLTEAPRNPTRNREKMAEIMFETFGVGGIYISIQGVLSLYATGRTTGLVLDIGDGVTHTIPIYDGYAVEHAINRFDLAGRDVTEYLQRLLERNGHSMNSSSEKEIVRRIKEKYIYCANDVEKEAELYKRKNMTRKYALPDGTTIKLSDEMYETPEVLFDPALIGKEIMGVHEAIHDSVQRADLDVRRDLYSNIVLSGGTTMIKKFPEKLEYELRQIVPAKTQIKIIAPPERKYSVWVGGSILSALPSFDRAWIYKSEYHECGASIVHDRCM